MNRPITRLGMLAGSTDTYTTRAARDRDDLRLEVWAYTDDVASGTGGTLIVRPDGWVVWEHTRSDGDIKRAWLCKLNPGDPIFSAMHRVDVWRAPDSAMPFAPQP